MTLCPDSGASLVYEEPEPLMDYVFGSAGAITGQGAENIPICEQRGKSVLNPHLLLLLSVLLLGVKLLFGDVPTAISFFRVALDVNKNRKLRVWLRYLLKGKVDNGDGEMQVIHFGKYNYPLLMGKISAYSSAPYQIFDRTINDPHRWLEDMDDSRTKLWLDEQKVVTNTILGDTQATPSNMESNVGGLLDAFASKIKQSGMFDDVDTVFQRGKSFFYFRSTKSVAGEPENIQLFITKSISADCFSGRLSRIDRVLLRQPDDESKTTISGTWIDNDGEMLAYALANDLDGDWLTIRVRDIVSGEDYEDTLTLNCHRASTAVTWHNKRTGFFYSCFDSGGSGMGGVPVTARHRVCFHRLNTAQSEDLVIYEDSEPSRDTKRSIFVPRMSHDSHYLLLEVYEEDFQFLQYVEGPHTSEGTDPVNRLFFVDTYRFNGHDLKTLGKVVKLIDGRGGNFRWDYITNIEEDFWFRTNYCAEHFRIVRVSVPSTDTITKARGARLQLLSDAAWHTALEWIPETADGAFLESASIAAQTVMVLKYIRGLSNDVVLYDLTQSLNDTSRRPCAELPNSPYGVIRGPYSNFYSNSIFYTTSSFSDPGSIWRATITRSSITHSVEVGFEPICFRKVPNVDLYSYEVSQLHIPCRRHCTVVAPDKGTRQGAETVYPSLQPFNGQQGGASASASAGAGAGAGAGGSQSPDRAVGGVREGNQKSNSRRRTYVDNSRDEVSLLLFHSRDYLNEDQFSSTPGASNATSRTSIRPSSHKAGAGMGMGLGSRRSGSRGVSGATVRESTLFKSAFGRSTKPCLLYVHGSFGVSVMPTFSLPLLLYCKHFEAMLCVVNVRGGGEFGPGWAAKGAGANKQHAVEDLISAADFLIASGYTSRDQLGVLSGNFGSTIVAAAMNQAPHLFKATVLEDGIFDLLRGEILTPASTWFDNGDGDAVDGGAGAGASGGAGGAADSSGGQKPRTTWEREFGPSWRSMEARDRVLELSPLHNIRAPLDSDSGSGSTSGSTGSASSTGPSFRHPSVMLVSHRSSPVPPQHSFKYLAELQRVWGVKGKGGPLVMLRGDNAAAAQAAAAAAAAKTVAVAASPSKDGVRGLDRDREDEDEDEKEEEEDTDESAARQTAAALFFLATQTGCTYRDKDDDDASTSGSDRSGSDSDSD